MVLIADGAFVEDSWRRLDDDDSLPPSGEIVVPLSRLPAALERGEAEPLGVSVANTTDPAELAPLFSRLALIDIVFPAFADGRGFSLARLLRRQGFQGELRASGKLTPDQYLHARGSGFDTIEIADDLATRQGETSWANASRARSLTYQRGYAAAGASILERRRKGAQ